MMSIEVYKHSLALLGFENPSLRDITNAYSDMTSLVRFDDNRDVEIFSKINQAYYFLISTLTNPGSEIAFLDSILQPKKIENSNDTKETEPKNCDMANQKKDAKCSVKKTILTRISSSLTPKSAIDKKIEAVKIKREQLEKDRLNAIKRKNGENCYSNKIASTTNPKKATEFNATLPRGGASSFTPKVSIINKRGEAVRNKKEQLDKDRLEVLKKKQAEKNGMNTNQNNVMKCNVTKNSTIKFSLIDEKFKAAKMRREQLEKERLEAKENRAKQIALRPSVSQFSAIRKRIQADKTEWEMKENDILDKLEIRKQQFELRHTQIAANRDKKLSLTQKTTNQMELGPSLSKVPSINKGIEANRLNRKVSEKEIMEKLEARKKQLESRHSLINADRKEKFSNTQKTPYKSTTK